MPPRRIVAALQEDFEGLARRPLEPVEVAIVDSGIDATHPELAGRVVAAYQIDDSNGEPRVRERPPGENADTFGHGTGVASLVARIAPNARLVDVRVLDENNLGSGRALVAGVGAVLERGSRVLNLSLAATAEFAPRLATLCERAYRANQVVVAARRNMPLADLGYPAELSLAISVDAMRSDSMRRVLWRGDDPIEFAAAGEDLVVAAPGGGSMAKTGTSFATPVVSGLVALILGAYPELEPFEVKTVLKALAT